eukprot:snap_masked-scaffold_60-processed-gene-0.1-mRNA-1 protein AED:1.00 eAED:1.00 QI:0/-1/0/0/-1/1/1/0/253
MLRSKGDTDFKDILLETPWDILAYDIDQDLDADQKYSPRAFKSHETYENIAKGGKYIFVKRNPYDGFVSAYNFLVQTPEINLSNCSMTAFAKVCFENRGRFPPSAEYIVSYVEALRKSPKNILFLFYEDMKEIPRENIEKIAKFMGLKKLSEEEFKARCDTAEMYSSLKYMKEIRGKFSSSEITERKVKNMSKTRAVFERHKLNLVRNGIAGGGKSIPVEIKGLIAKSWKNNVEQKLGFSSYEELRNEFMTTL